LAARYNAAFQSWPMVTPRSLPDSFSAYHLYVIQVEKRDAVFKALRAAGIGVNVHYIPVHLQPYYRAMGFKPGDFLAAEAYYAHAISLPIFAALTEVEQDYVIAQLKPHVVAR
jgi:dTDP-4-amino-4,6-dideoxygalactose transaminase